MSWYIVRFEGYGRILRYLVKFRGERLRKWIRLRFVLCVLISGSGIVL